MPAAEAPSLACCPMLLAFADPLESGEGFEVLEVGAGLGGGAPVTAMTALVVPLGSGALILTYERDALPRHSLGRCECSL